MWKKILISVGLIIILAIGVGLVAKNKKSENPSTSNIVSNETEISSQYVTDDCIDEWEDYVTSVKEELKETNSNLNDENKTYILRAENDVIKIYYINEEGEEVLYRVTDVSVEYLEQSDVERLNQGIKVEGLQAANEMLEDFE